MRSLLSLCLATAAVVAQAGPVPEPHLAGVLEPLTAAQWLLPVRVVKLSVNEGIAHCRKPQPLIG